MDGWPIAHGSRMGIYCKGPVLQQINTSGNTTANKVAWNRSNSTDVVTVFTNPISGTITKNGWKPRAIGTLASNGWGLFDMSGNVMEWCNDWYGSDYYAKSDAQDPQGPTSGMFRGTSWWKLVHYCRILLRIQQGIYTSRNQE